MMPNARPSLQARLIARALRRLIKPRQYGPDDVPLLRGLMQMLARTGLPGGMRAEKPRDAAWQAAGLHGEWLMPQYARRGRALLYLHGGGFISGAARTHRPITTRLAQKLAVPVLALDYRLAPEHPYPAALHDALAAWHWLTGPAGYRPDRLWLAGDSAGGGLALSLMLALRDKGLAQPAGAALFSPWTDLSMSGASHTENAEHCAWFNPGHLVFAARLYAGAADRHDALVSPRFARLAGLAPLFLHASDSEMMRDDSTALASAADFPPGGALTVWHGLPHAWPNFAGLMPEADHCLELATEQLSLLRP